MKTIFHLTKWPDKTKRVQVDSNDTSTARLYILENYPDWSISMFAPVFVTPPPPPPSDPFPSLFHVPVHLRPLIQDDNFGVRYAYSVAP
jgi:hypothetical protein